jgi:hypothetical protein
MEDTAANSCHKPVYDLVICVTAILTKYSIPGIPLHSALFLH